MSAAWPGGVFVFGGEGVVVPDEVGGLSGLLQTLMATVEPLRTVVPPTGVCASTRPSVDARHLDVVAGIAFSPLAERVETATVSGSPTTFGTRTLHGPLDTCRSTFAPGATCVPAVGDCDVTMPLPYWFEHTVETVPAASPVAPSTSPALATVSPTTSGTTTEFRVATVRVTTLPSFTR